MFGLKQYPYHVFLIILNEFCERFSYYGLRTVLYLYLTEFVKMDNDTSTAVYHAFTCLCYFSPILGAVIADGYIGLYRTIVYLSLFYLLGEVILTLTSIKTFGAPNIAGPMIGLMIISIGTGGIKPCVSAFGGNQFESNQKRYIETFFSIFYLSINVGSTIATIITPIFRSDIKCFGNDCYPLAFGVPSIFMFLSILLFILGTRYYKRNDTKNENIIIQTASCICNALYNKLTNKTLPKKDHWLEYAQEKYSVRLVDDIKILCKILFVFLPLPIFWALYDQQGSRWTSQAQQMNGKIGSAFFLKPDQIQAINPLLIILLAPIFDAFVYPFFSRFNLLKSQLQRMGIGLIFAILSFLIAALLEYKMQVAYNLNNSSETIRLLNLSPCNLNIYHGNESILYLNKVNYLENKAINFESRIFKKNDEPLLSVFYLDCNIENNHSINFSLKSKDLPKTVIFYQNKNKLDILEKSYNLNEPIIGSSQIQFLSMINLDYKVILQNDLMGIRKFGILDFNSQNDSSYHEIDYAQYTMKIIDQQANNITTSLFEKTILLESCGRYTILLFENLIIKSIDYVFLTDIYPNGIHVLWQLIQIFVMTIGEVMYSISGLSFAYSQAPESLKSVLQAAWFLTVAIGNLIIVFVAEVKLIENQVWEYVMYAGLLAISTIIFITISYNYDYVDNNLKPEFNKIDSSETFGSENSEEQI